MLRPPKPCSLSVIVLSCPIIGSLSSSTANQRAADNNYQALVFQDLYFLKHCYLYQVINQFKNFQFTQFMNAPCRTVLKQLLLPAMVTSRALNSALFIIFHTHFCPLQFKVFQGCLKWCIMRLVNLKSQWVKMFFEALFLFPWTQI